MNNVANKLLNRFLTKPKDFTYNELKKQRFYIMKDVLSYKGFIGSVHFSTDDKVFCGKIEGIDDLVTFESKDVNGLIKAFKEKVNDYILFCKELGKKPEKSYKGSFNVRIPPRIHKKAIEKELQHT